MSLTFKQDYQSVKRKRRVRRMIGWLTISAVVISTLVLSDAIAFTSGRALNACLLSGFFLLIVAITVFNRSSESASTSRDWRRIS